MWLARFRAFTKGPERTAIAAARKFLGNQTFELVARGYVAWRNGERSWAELFAAGARRARQAITRGFRCVGECKVEANNIVHVDVRNKEADIAVFPGRFDLSRAHATYKLEAALLFNDLPQPWRGMEVDQDHVNPIPSMISEDESRFLYWLARDCYSGAGAIVDLGPLAGGSTHSLAAGLSQNPAVPSKREKIHSYDLWRFYEGWEWIFPVLTLRQGQDLEPVFRSNLSGLLELVVSHKGDLASYAWSGDPVEILFVDAAKTSQTLVFIINYYFPWLIPGRSVLIHQDFICSECPWIHISCEVLKDYFQYLDSPDDGTICFVPTKSIPPGVLPDNYFDTLAVRDARHLLAEARKNVRGWYKLCVWLSEAHYLAMAGLYGEAAEVVREVQADPQYDEHVNNDVVLVASKLPRAFRKGISIVPGDKRFLPPIDLDR